MGDLNESVIALLMALIAATSDGTDQGQAQAQAERDTGWQHFAMIASDIRAAEPVPACHTGSTVEALDTSVPNAPMPCGGEEATAATHIR
jgi:hypothetical protein